MATQPWLFVCKILGRWHGQPPSSPGIVIAGRWSKACLGQAKRATCPHEFFLRCKAAGITSGQRALLFRVGELDRTKW